MDKFKLYNNVYKESIKTKFGVISINNIEFDSLQIQRFLPDIVFEDENLKFMFQETSISNRKKSLILKRFLPNTDINDIGQYITESIKSNKTFYSFLAEGMLGLVFRDIFGYDLSVGIIDIKETLNDTHSGADVCLFDKENNALVIGEAKFYETFKKGMNAVISDFVKKKIVNKLDSFKRKIESNDTSWEIVIKNLKKDDYEIISLTEFMNQKIIFAGFVLHNNAITMEEYLESNFYNDFNISIESLKYNVAKDIEIDFTKCEYNIVLFHLPINSKKTLIKEIIERADTELKHMIG
ncbi:Hachiman antiphage defense system protein HamA [Thomasclavelia spiroformis]|uniref:Hachiman antiphage defense system protein HamA n=1 Tax=Thomasclavelia spiroformis TaxID=29348 RepID=UPI00241F5A35|nr:hypothetical protein [Thomasclavelia spiroformis]MBS6115080.1 hypothetical protein [Thomasclavelia spiroformis]